jgi:DNA-binding MurR/RpiR family transcriptional regulator
MKINETQTVLGTETAPQPEALSETNLGARLLLSMTSGSTAHRRLAEYILRHPIRVSALSIDDLAQATGVSAPTISRFARELAFGGFAELRTAVAEAMQAFLDPVAKLRFQLEMEGCAARSGDMLVTIQRQVQRLDASLMGAQITAIAEELVQARAIYVMGFGLSSHVAALLVLGLQPYCANVTTVVDFGGTEVAAGRLMGTGPGDVLIAITFPRYAKDVVNLTRYARDRGAKVFALTDSAASPIAPLADMMLIAPSDHPTLSSSMTGAVAVIETLVATVMLSDPANAEKAARLGEAIGAYLHED